MAQDIKDSVKAYRDINNAINTAKKDATKDVARRMKGKGMDIADIAEVTGLTITEIYEL